MARILPEVLSPINDVPLTPKVVDSVGYTLSVDPLLRAHSKVFLLFETMRLFNTCLEHLTGLLTQFWELVMVWLKVFFPSVLHKRSHFTTESERARDLQISN